MYYVSSKTHHTIFPLLEDRVFAEQTEFPLATFLSALLSTFLLAFSFFLLTFLVLASVLLTANSLSLQQLLNHLMGLFDVVIFVLPLLGMGGGKGGLDCFTRGRGSVESDVDFHCDGFFVLGGMCTIVFVFFYRGVVFVAINAEIC